MPDREISGNRLISVVNFFSPTIEQLLMSVPDNQLVQTRQKSVVVSLAFSPAFADRVPDTGYLSLFGVILRLKCKYLQIYFISFKHVSSLMEIHIRSVLDTKEKIAMFCVSQS